MRFKGTIRSILLVVLAIAAGSAFAQDCAAPLPLMSGSLTPVAGDTCTAGNPLPTFGGTGSPQNDVVYSFVASDTPGIFSITATGGYAGTTAAIFLLPTCTPATDPIAFGAPGADMLVSRLTGGQTYYVIVTADPGGPNAGCGQYDLFATYPVTLQSFSVE